MPGLAVRRAIQATARDSISVSSVHHAALLANQTDDAGLSFSSRQASAVTTGRLLEPRHESRDLCHRLVQVVPRDHVAAARPRTDRRALVHPR